MKRNKTIEKLASIAHKSKVMKSLFRGAYRRLYVKSVEDRSRAQFLKNGLMILETFDQLMKNADIKYSLDFGTLLGAVREKGFIKHDLDIDVAILGSEDKGLIRNMMIDAGFKFEHSIAIEGGEQIMEESFSFEEVGFDVFYYYPCEDNYHYTAVFTQFEDTKSWEESIQKYSGLRARKLISYYTEQMVYMPFETSKFPCFTNAEDALVTKYGESWRVPDPTCCWPKIPKGALTYYMDDTIGIVEY